MCAQEKEKGVKGKELEHSVRARNEFTKRLNKRRTAESSLHNIAMQMNGRALSKLHDAGKDSGLLLPFSVAAPE